MCYKMGKKQRSMQKACAALLIAAAVFAGGCGKNESDVAPEESAAESMEGSAVSAEQAEGSTADSATLSPFQSYLSQSIEDKANETTLSREERESVEASEQESRKALRESVEAAAAASQAADQAAVAASIDASIEAEQSREAALDASEAEADRIRQSLEESQAEAEMAAMNASAEAELAEMEGDGPANHMNAETAPSPAAPGQ